VLDFEEPQRIQSSPSLPSGTTPSSLALIYVSMSNLDAPPSISGLSGISRFIWLDALRAIALLLVVPLSTVLVFDSSASSGPFYEWLGAAIQGFQAPLFLLVSGYFSMMVCRRKGVSVLLVQRLQRVLVPCLISLFLVVPAFTMARDFLRSEIRQSQQNRSNLESASEPEPEPEPKLKQAPISTEPQPETAATGPTDKGPELRDAVRTGNIARATELLEAGAKAEGADPKTEIPPLHVAAARGDLPMVQLLLQHKAKKEAEILGGYQVLQTAFLFGRNKVAEYLIEQGAKPHLRRGKVDLSSQALRANQFVTQRAASQIGIPKVPFTLVWENRRECQQLLTNIDNANLLASRSKMTSLDRMQFDYRDMVKNVQTYSPWPVFTRDEFHQLWMLWMFWILLVLFALWSGFTRTMYWLEVPTWMVMSPLRLIWLIPLSLLPQLLMQMDRFGFGPDPAPTWIPMPHLLAYYGLFFVYGIMYYGCRDEDRELGSWWWMWLLLGLGIALPVGLLGSDPLAKCLASVVYAWAMCFGLIGLFARFFNAENPPFRNLLDASFFIYLFHSPLIAVFQAIAQRLRLPFGLSCLLACVGTVGFLWGFYFLLLQRTKLGMILSGFTTARAQTMRQSSQS